MNTRMNLTGLADLANAQLANRGRPFELALDDVSPDPGNPRSADEERSAAATEAQEELAADVAARGVKAPISVRPHPGMPGKYIINYGHRRYRAARSSALVTIPAFIDEKFDSYDQVNENELRTGLTSRERALFIKGRLDAGDSKSEIAERMRKKNQAFITEHLALIDAPDCVNRAYAAGVTSARTLYDLRQAWQAFPLEVDAWCRNIEQISRDAIKDALAGFRHDEAGAATKESMDVMDTKPIDLLQEKKAVLLPAVHPPSNAEELRCVEQTEMKGAGDDCTAPRPDRDLRMPHDLGLSGTMLESVDRASLGDGILVRYEGKMARISRDAVVTIVLEETGGVLNVPLSGLVFEG